MIPNSAPMAAVYRHAHDNHLSSRPVAGWDENDHPLVCCDGAYGVQLASVYQVPDAELLGMWQYGWHPTPDEMATLLPDHVPGTPHPLSVPVTLREVPGGWIAVRADGPSVAETVTYDQMKQRLYALGGFHITDVVQAERDED